MFIWLILETANAPRKPKVVTIEKRKIFPEAAKTRRMREGRDGRARGSIALSCQAGRRNRVALATIG